MDDVFSYSDYDFADELEWGFGGWEGFGEFHSPDSVTWGELVQAGFIDMSDRDTWAWPKFSDEQDIRLRNKISNRFWDRSIGILPPGLWRRQFIEKMCEIMPKYLRLYQALEESPELLGASSEYYKSRNIFSDFPQTQLSGNSDYASTGNDTQWERIRQLDIADMADRLKTYRDVDVLVMEEMEELFSCLASVAVNTR